MQVFWQILIPLALTLVLLVLALGLVAFSRGGSLGRTYSNLLMRWRVALQLVAILLIMLAAVFFPR
jgi:hypothetical protein